MTNLYELEDDGWLEGAESKEPPVNGWDNPVDIAQAETFLKFAPPEAIRANAEQLRAFGLSEAKAAKLMRRQWPDCDKDRIKRAYESASGAPGIDSHADGREYESEFQLNQLCKPKAADPQNIRVALNKLGVSLRFNAFTRTAIIEGLPGFGPLVQDDCVRRLRFIFRDRFEFLPEKDLLFEFVLHEAQCNSFHPVRDYFDQVQAAWDGKPRLDRFLINYAGAEDTLYVRAVGRLPFVAAVRRIRSPGAKYDEMLVLESGQGKDKSSALEIMAIRREWFSDSFSLSADGRKTLEDLQGKLIVECAELQGMRKGEIEHVKAMLSRTVDRGRPVYGRLQTEQPRECVIIGTANDRNYLKDATGNRRFWPVAVKQFDLEALRRDVGQLWGEAATCEALGESIRLDRSLWQDAAVQQKARSDIAIDAFVDAFRIFLDDKRGKIGSEDAWRILGMDRPGLRTQEHNRRFGAALKFLGWKRQPVWIQGRKTNGYVKGDSRKRIVVAQSADGAAFVDYEEDAPSED